MSTPQLNRPLTLQERQRRADGAGGFIEDWVTLGQLWGEVKPGSGRERAGPAMTLSSVPYRLTLRAAPHGAPSRPQPGHRLLDGTRVFAVEAVAEADTRGRYLTVFAHEEVST